MAKKKIKDNVLINGIDVESWLDTPPTSAELAPEPLHTYEKRLVAFLDLLGITAEVLQNTNGSESVIIKKMIKIKEIVEREIADTSSNKDIFMLYISDSFIFVCKEEILPHMLSILSNIQMRILVECQTMLRGALEFGDVIIEDEGKQIIGPAYIEAYIKQERHAIFPRIIIGNSVISLINRQHEKYDKLIVSQDREYSLDYVDVYSTLESKSTKDIVTRLRREGVFEYLRNNYKEFDKKDKPSIRAKYAWTINYLKEKGVWPDEKQYNCW